MKFADPKNDMAFKKIFGDEHHKEVLISFLNAILDFQDEQTIVEVTLVNPYQVPKIEALKETILDIKATNQKGEQFIVEMQKNDQGDFAKRSLYYTAKAYVNQMDGGDNYQQLEKVYFIGILDFKMFENQNCVSRHLILNQETQTQDLADFEFCFVELPKFKKDLNELENRFERWLYFLKYASSFDLIPAELSTDPQIEQAFQALLMYGWSKQEMDVYDYMCLQEGSRLDQLRTAEQKGMKQGMKQGIEQGIEQVAVQLLDILDDQTLAEKTGLNLTWVQELRKAHNHNESS